MRGGTDLAFPPVRHTALETLVVETGGLGAEVVRGIVGSDLPALENLELWLGTDEYGGDSTPRTWPRCSPARPSPPCATWACATA